MEALVTYAALGILLNLVIHFEFQGDPPRPVLDSINTFVFFYILWPLGLIVFILKWYQGRGSINGVGRDD